MYLYRGSHLSRSYDGLWDLLLKRPVQHNFGTLWHSGLWNHVCNWWGLVHFDKGKGLLSPEFLAVAISRHRKHSKMSNTPPARATGWQRWHWPTGSQKLLPEQPKLQAWNGSSVGRAAGEQSPERPQEKNPHRFPWALWCSERAAASPTPLGTSTESTEQTQAQWHRSGSVGAALHVLSTPTMHS